MKKLLTLIAITVVAAGLASAQSAGPAGGAPPQGGNQTGKATGPGGKRENPQKEILAQLGLSKDQRKQIEALGKQSKSDREAIQAKVKAGTLDKKAGRTQIMALMKTHHEAMMKILTPAQQAKFKDLMAKWVKDHPNAGKGKGGGKLGG